MTRIEHLPSCDLERLERADSLAPGARRATVIRCQSCGAQLVLAEPEQQPDPNSPEYATLWETDPQRIARQLSPAERCDPEKNPAHPWSTWPACRTPMLPSTPAQVDPTLRAQLARRQS